MMKALFILVFFGSFCLADTAGSYAGTNGIEYIQLLKADPPDEVKNQGSPRRMTVIVCQLASSGILALGASLPFILPFYNGAIEYGRIIPAASASALGYVFLSSGAIHGIGKLGGYKGHFWKTLIYGGLLPIGLGALSTGLAESDRVAGIPYGVHDGEFARKIFYWYGGAILGIWASPVLEMLVYHIGAKR